MNQDGSQGRIIRIDEGLVKKELGEVVRDTVEETLNRMLDAAADSHETLLIDLAVEALDVLV